MYLLFYELVSCLNAISKSFVQVIFEVPTILDYPCTYDICYYDLI